ncbi:N-acetylglucosamine-6-phosphate deacetylase [Pukyongiella litopenaei]|uniref:N-acetylglucosamine-6-phosphate deacetylase n=1 Tax=Pukyongiella litopenaei TaxID=2605946 RepID=A0A2S0MRZ5_9RHOB|nr:N-acetylglucosamine-6-phosphate deacetylase [Pukyongiella litopenaei]AVO38587.1 N-acetylglucosamine-6-phosphate deacetylase [Pukyongiella litopenaei]
MTGRERIALTGAEIFDGERIHRGRALLLDGDHVAAIADEVPGGTETRRLDGGILSPGFVDLQVNGGGGVMFNDAPTVETLGVMAEAHAGLGATSILPTLITDRPDITRAAIAAVRDARAEGVAGIAGLHLEGPHLSLARKGAHDPALIRPMQADDLDLLLAAARQVPVLKVTIAPESVTPAQKRAMAEAGILLSLGHSDAGFAACADAAGHGVRCVTHLFNAMSQLGSREPGLVGAALECGALSAGLIADMIHVHPRTIAAALRAKRGPGRIFLVSDAMATAGSEIAAFTLNGREIRRADGRLTLADGTLAGADLDLARALRNVMAATDADLPRALAMATAIPAALIGCDDRIGRLVPGARADILHLSDDLRLRAVWRGGAPL